MWWHFYVTLWSVFSNLIKLIQFSLDDWKESSLVFNFSWKILFQNSQITKQYPHSSSLFSSLFYFLSFDWTWCLIKYSEYPPHFCVVFIICIWDCTVTPFRLCLKVPIKLSKLVFLGTAVIWSQKSPILVIVI